MLIDNKTLAAHPNEYPMNQSMENYMIGTIQDCYDHHCSRPTVDTSRPKSQLVHLKCHVNCPPMGSCNKTQNYRLQVHHTVKWIQFYVDRLRKITRYYQCLQTHKLLDTSQNNFHRKIQTCTHHR